MRSSHRVQKTVLYICVSFAVLHTDGMGREVGGGFRMGNTVCTPPAPEPSAKRPGS